MNTANIKRGNILFNRNRKHITLHSGESALEKLGIVLAKVVF